MKGRSQISYPLSGNKQISLMICINILIIRLIYLIACVLVVEIGSIERMMIKRRIKLKFLFVYINPVGLMLILFYLSV